MPSQETDHVSPTEVTPELGKGALDTWRPVRPCGGRLDKPAPTPSRLRGRGCGQTRSGRGVHDPAFEPLQAMGRLTADMPRFQTGLGKSDRPAL